MLCLSKRHIFGQKFIFWHFEVQFIIRIIGIIVTYKRSKIFKTNSQSQQIKTKKKWRNETSWKKTSKLIQSSRKRRITDKYQKDQKVKILPWKMCWIFHKIRTKITWNQIKTLCWGDVNARIYTVSLKPTETWITRARIHAR